jgi:uncharacterized protein YraI
MAFLREAAKLANARRESAMQSIWLGAAATLIGIAAAPVAASAAATAYSAPGYTNLRAGPGTEHRVLAHVAGGSRVHVDGCLSTRSWCYVTVADWEGWMASSRLLFTYDGRAVYVREYYDYFSAPIIPFHFGRYHWWEDDDDDDGNWTGYPGGTGPGPETIPPVEPVEDVTGHPGGGDPGPETIYPPGQDGGGNWTSPPGGSPGPETLGSDGQILCPLDNPNC